MSEAAPHPHQGRRGLKVRSVPGQGRGRAVLGRHRSQGPGRGRTGRDPRDAVSGARGRAEPPAATTPPDLDAVRAALKAGDLDALSDLLGEDPALYAEKSTKWAAARRKEKKLKDERDSVGQKAEAIVKRWAPVADAAQAVQGGEFVRFVELAEALTGMDYDALVMKVARARHGSDPQVAVLKKRLAEVEPVVAEQAAAKTTAAERAFYETLRDEVPAKHALRGLEGWEAKVAAVLKESIDEDLGEPTLSAKQAADRVLRREREEFDRKAKLFGVSAPAAPKGRAPERASGAAPTTTRKLSREEWLAAQK
jgi:hypothetical protein